MKSIWISIVALFTLVPSFSQAQSQGQIDVPVVAARTPQNVKTGKVLDIQYVQIEVPANNTTVAVGAAIGATGGAYAASKQSWQGQALMGVIGGAIGKQVAQSLSHEMRDAQQIIVQFDNGTAQAFVQEPNGPAIEVGQSVYVIGQGSAVRVMPLQKSGG